MAADAVAAGWRFLPSAWRRAPLAMLLAVAAAVLIRETGIVGWLARALLALGLVMTWGALFRVALLDANPGLLGLRFGATEARLICALALRAAFLTIIFLLAFTVLLAFAYASASAGHGFVSSDVRTWAGAADARGRVVMALAAVACAGFWLWAQARTALAAAATVARGRVQVLAAWPLTRSRAISVLFVQFACALPGVVLLWAASALESWSFLLCAVATLAGVWLPLTAGAGAYLYRVLELQDPPYAG